MRTDEGTPSASAGTCGLLNAPVASTTVSHCHSPSSVVTSYPPLLWRTDVTDVPVWTGAEMAVAYDAMKSATSEQVMKPSGSSPSYDRPGSRHCQLGVSSRSESHRCVRQDP